MEQYLTHEQVVELFLKAGNPRKESLSTGGFYIGAMSFDSYDLTYNVKTHFCTDKRCPICSAK